LPGIPTGPEETVKSNAYDPQGRRDPFVSLRVRSGDVGRLHERPSGLAGLSITEMTLMGLVLSRGTYCALMQATDGKTYILRGDEQLFEGVVKSMSVEGVSFLQFVNDPLSGVREREVLRRLPRRQDGR